MDAIVRRLETWIRKNHPELRTELKKGMMARRLVDLEEESGADLSDDFRTLLRWRNGQKPHTTEHFCVAGHLLGAEGINGVWSDWMELEYNGRFPTADWFHPAWVPFAGGKDDTYLCVDSTGAYDGQPGQVIEFRANSAQRVLRAESLGQWLNGHVTACEKGLITMSEGEYQVVERTRKAYEKLIKELCPGYPIEVMAGAEEKPAFHRLLDAIRDDKLDSASEILENEEVEINRTGPDGRPPLVSASISGNPEMVRLLLANGASVPWEDWTDGRRALHWACEYGPKVVPVLVEAGADVNRVLNYSALTPLMLAAWSGHLASVELLLEAGADPLRKSSLGETAFSKSEEESVRRVLDQAVLRASAK